MRPGRCLGRGPTRWALSAAAGLAAWSMAARASGQPIADEVPPPRLTASLGWARMPEASSCSGGATIARAVEAILRRDALAPASRADLVIEARVERVRGRRRYRAVIEIARPDGAVIGTRTLDSASDDCRRLDEPVALAIALMIDPDAVTRLGEPMPEPAPPPPVVAVVRDVLMVPVPMLTPAAPAAPPPDPTSEGPWLGFSLGPSLALGLVPEVGVGLRAAVEVGPPADRRPEGLAWGPSSIRLGLGAYGGSVEVSDAPSADTASLSLAAVLPRLELCPTTAWIGERAALTACAALDVGAITWTGEGFDASVEGTARPFVSVGPTVRGRVVVVGPLAIELGVAGVIPLVRDRFVFTRGTGTTELAHQPSVVGGTAEVGLHLGL